MDDPSDSPVPDWIKRRSSEEEDRKRQAEAKAQRQAVADLKVQAEGPEFWKELLSNLRITVRALPTIGIRGTVSAIDATQAQPEHSCHIDLVREGAVPQQTYLNLFYAPNGSVIRCHSLHGESFELLLCIDVSNHIACMQDSHVMNSKRAAQALIEPLVDRIEKG